MKFSLSVFPALTASLALLATFTFCVPGFAGTATPKDSYDLHGYIHHESQNLKPWIKFVAVKKAEKLPELFLISDDDATFHAEYVKSKIRQDLTLDQVNRAALFHEGREFYFGTLFLGREKFDSATKKQFYREAKYDLVSKDFPTASDVHQLDIALKDFLKLAVDQTKLFYAPLGKFEEATNSQAAQFQSLGIKISQQDDLQINREIYTPGWAIGKIHRLTALASDQAVEEGKTFPNEILVIEGAPSDLPLAAGYILSLPTSPNSHPALLAKMNGAPMIFQRNAYQESKIKALENSKQFSLFLVKDPTQESGTYRRRNIYLGNIDPEGKKTLEAFKVKKKLGALKFSSTLQDFQESSEAKIESFDEGAYGSKAKGLVEIQRSVDPKFTIPSLFLPLFYQIDFFSRAKVTVEGKKVSLRKYLDEKLTNSENISSVALAEKLTSIRAAILNAETTDDFFAPLITRIGSFAQKTGAKKVFLRSSSNAEDGDVFNGAGLYDSKSANLDAASIERSVRIVWASLYNFKAYYSRMQFGIDENTVGMAIVVQGFLQDVQAQGVAIGKIDPALKRTDVFFTSFPGSLQVTTPPPGVSPEQGTVEGLSLGEKQFYLKSLCRGCGDALRLGETILLPKEYIELSNQIDKLLGNWNKELDVEWLKSGDQIHIVQVRAVPQAQKLPVTMLAGTDEIQFHRDRIDGDSEDPAILKIRGEIQLKLKLSTQASLNRNWIEELSYSYLGERRSISKQDLNIVEEIKDGDRKYLFVSLNHPQIPSLALEIHRPIYSDSPDPKTITELLTPLDFEFKLSFTGSDFFPKSNRKDMSAYFYGEMVLNSKYRIDLDFNSSSLTAENPVSVTVFGKRKNLNPIKFHVNYLKDNDEKHYALKLVSASIENFIPGKVMNFSNPAAMAYTATDHHLSPEFAIDLTLNDAKETLPANIFKGARYLWIFTSGLDPTSTDKNEMGDDFGGMALIGANGEWLGELTEGKADSVRMREE